MFCDILNNIFKEECSYAKINETSTVKLRNHKNGIQIQDLFLYRFLYSKKDMTKERICSIINDRNDTHFTRQAFDNKENNVPVSVYTNIFNRILEYSGSINNDDKNTKLIGIDGTYNNDSSMDEMLNMGFFRYNQ